MKLPGRADLFCRLLLAVAALGAANPKSARATEPRYQALDPDLGTLRERFNADAGYVRVLLLLSPT